MWRGLAAKNADLGRYACFLGAGAYDHLIPAAVGQLVSRSEFYTSYTPYQPEITQGVLQATYEYQTLIAQLTGMDLANASIYDGATALAEAALVACAHTRREKVLVPQTVHPEYRQVVAHVFAPSRFGTRRGAVRQTASPTWSGCADTARRQHVAAVVVQQPNFFGRLEDAHAFGALAEKHGALLIVAHRRSADPGRAGSARRLRRRHRSRAKASPWATRSASAARI